MLDLLIKKTTQQRLFFCFCLSLTFCGKTLGHENGPEVVKVVVNEGSDAILPCSLSTKENIVQKLFDWRKARQEVFMYDAGVHYNNGRSGQDEQFRGRVSHFPEQLKFGNASIIIRKTKVTDSGNYTCDFPRLRQIFHINLVVERVFRDRSGEVSGAPSDPFITIADVTEEGVLLQCVVKCVFPKPTLRWQDSDGNILPAEEPQVSERGGSYDIILQTTVTKTTTNCFYCEVKQEEIGHIVNKSITVPEKLFGDESCQTVRAWIGVWFLGVLTAVAAAVALFVGRKYITTVWEKGVQQQRNDSCNCAAEPLTSGPV